MVTKGRAVVLGGLLLLGMLGTYGFVTREERAVRKKYAALAEWVRKEPGEPPLEKAVKARAAAGVFHDPCLFEIQTYEISAEVSLQQLAGIALQGRERFSELDLEFYDLAVNIPQPGHAETSATAHLMGKKAGGDGVNETHEISASLAKGEDGWRFKRITAVEVLQK